MGLKIDVTSATEALEIEVKSAAEAPEIKLTSTAEAPETEVASAAEAPETEVASAAEAPVTEVVSAAEAPETEEASTIEAPETEVASAAAVPETEVASAAASAETKVASAVETLETKVVSAAEAPKTEVASTAEAPETEVASASEALETEVASATEAPEIEVASAAEAPQTEVASAAEAPETEVASAAEGQVVGQEVRTEWLYNSTSSSDSIFRAPEHIRYGRESDFVPKLVSIGPYHRGRPNLQPMEETKVRCMSNLLMVRPGDENKGEDKFLFYNRGGSNMDRVPVNAFMKFERRARSFYKEKFDKKISAVEFVRMLLLDSCFVIRIVLTLLGAIPESMGSLEVNIKEVRSDLLLLENQIPLFFIHEVYEWLFPNRHEDIKLTYILGLFIELDLPWTNSFNCLFFESDHLLDFYWKSSVPDTEHLTGIIKSHKQTPRRAHIPSSLPKLIANATELHQIAGIKFEKYYNLEDHIYGLQVEFSKGIMRIGCLKINSSLPTSLINLIAFENCMPYSIRIISTYVKILDDLIDSEKDVELLQKFGVIYNTLSSHTNAATFFNDIGNLSLIDEDDNPFSDLFWKVKKYYNSCWNRSWASLRNNYFNSPWAGISVFAAVVLLFLAAVQTYYTVFPKN